MEKIITEKDIDEIVKTYPNPKIMIPHSAFEDQLKNHLRKYFGFQMIKKQEKEKKDEYK